MHFYISFGHLWWTLTCFGSYYGWVAVGDSDHIPPGALLLDSVRSVYTAGTCHSIIMLFFELAAPRPGPASAAVHILRKRNTEKSNVFLRLKYRCSAGMQRGNEIGPVVSVGTGCVEGLRLLLMSQMKLPGLIISLKFTRWWSVSLFFSGAGWIMHRWDSSLHSSGRSLQPPP